MNNLDAILLASSIFIGFVAYIVYIVFFEKEEPVKEGLKSKKLSRAERQIMVETNRNKKKDLDFLLSMDEHEAAISN